MLPYYFINLTQSGRLRYALDQENVLVKISGFVRCVDPYLRDRLAENHIPTQDSGIDKQAQPLLVSVVSNLLFEKVVELEACALLPLGYVLRYP